VPATAANGSCNTPAALLTHVRAVSQIITNKLVGEKYLLYHCGTGKPAAAASFTKVFQLPLTSASVADATAADFMVSRKQADFQYCWCVKVS
jgi:hypothetical protein